MEAQEIGSVPGAPIVSMDSNAAAADMIIPIRRIKQHTTGLRGRFESGAVRLLVVGLGKRMGAAAIHACGMESFGRNLEEAGRLALAKMHVPFAVCVIENAYDRTARVEVVPGAPPAGQIPGRKAARRRDRRAGRRGAGKERQRRRARSQRHRAFLGREPAGGAKVRKFVAFDLTEHSHGDGIDMGLADMATAAVLEKLDIAAMYLNAVTSTVLNAPKIPVIMRNDRPAIASAINTCNRRPAEGLRIVGIRNTLELETVYLSQRLLRESQGEGGLTALGPLGEMRFDGERRLLWFDGGGLGAEE